MNLKLNLMVIDILNVNLTLINIMEKYLLILLLILLISLTISFIVFIVDYKDFKESFKNFVELIISRTNYNIKVLDSTFNNLDRIINVTEGVNNSVGDICKLNDKLILHIHSLLKENNSLRNKLEDKEETNEG